MIISGMQIWPSLRTIQYWLRTPIMCLQGFMSLSASGFQQYIDKAISILKHKYQVFIKYKNGGKIITFKYDKIKL
jgi:hypothetical protein